MKTSHLRVVLFAAVLIVGVCAGYAHGQAKGKNGWLVSEDTMRQYVQERATQCQSWLLANLTAEQCAAFEEFITPPRSDDQKLADLKTAISIIERSGGDPSDVKRQIEEAERVKAEAEAVEAAEAEGR